MARRGRPPATGKPTTPADLVLTGAVARRHYIDRRTNVQIADEFGLSRFQVARMLDEARDRGWVRIEIDLPFHIDDALSLAVAERLGLERAVVVDAPQQSEAVTRDELARVIAALLESSVQADQVVGFAWSRAVVAMTGRLQSMPPCTVVQLSGSLAVDGSEAGTVEVVRHVAAVSRGPLLPIYAPLIVPDASTATSLIRRPEIARALSAADRLDIAVIAIGAWADGASTVWPEVDPEVREDVRRRGAVGEASGRPFDADGNDVTGGFDDCVVGVTLDQLRRTPEVIATAYGANRAAAVQAAVQGGIVGTLVIDTTLARAIVEDVAD